MRMDALMSLQAIANFLPSKSGFQFPNCFPAVPLLTLRVPFCGHIGLGNAAGGLCGGMVYAVCDYYENSVVPDLRADPPLPPHPLYRYLAKRLIQSFGIPWGILKYYLWMVLPDNNYRLLKSIQQRSYENEWPKVRGLIDSGRPATLGLVIPHSWKPASLKLNHQVLAYGYEIPSPKEIVLHIYDPNQPGDDTVRLTIMLRESGSPVITYSHHFRIRAFFCTPYRRNSASLLPFT